MRCATLAWPKCTWHVVPLDGAMHRGDMYEVGLEMPPLRGALSLLHHRSFQHVS